MEITTQHSPAAIPTVAARHPGGVAPTTTIPPRPEPLSSPETRRVTRTLGGRDALAVIGAATAAVATTSVVFVRLAPFDGVLGFVVMAYALFVGFYCLLVALDETGPIVRDRVAAVVVHSLGFVLLAALAAVIIYTMWRGWNALSHLNFFTEDMAEAGPLQGLEIGGILHAIVGTLEQIAIALLVTVPLGLLCAVFLAEIPGPFSAFVRTIVEAMTALPSIIAGLFVYATVILVLDVDKSGLAAGLAISIMMLPIVIRAADVVIRLVPGSLREASLALGASQWRTVWHVVLPTARSGLTTAVILGTARGVGETSPVLLTAGFTANLNLDPTVGPQVSLPLFTFNSVTRPDAAMIERGFGAATVLLALVLLLFVIARMIGGRGPGQLRRRQWRRARRASHRDAVRFARRRADTRRPSGDGETAHA